ncbi:hypothetical protein F4678DRAFT_482748 [Xylaria arbuscula]|nr:hypothetical protein F4678DRAFT_482748 [Xylaria arbuscula]
MLLQVILVAIFGTLALFNYETQVLASFTNQGGRSPYYRGAVACPISCSQAGPSPSNWPLYHNIDQLNGCDETLFYDFSLHDPVDEPSSLHHLYTCTVGGGDWTHSTNRGALVLALQTSGTYEIGWWSSASVPEAQSVHVKHDTAGVRAVSRQIREYLTNGHAPAGRPALLFAQMGKAMLGIYVGKALQKEGTGETALKAFEKVLSSKSGNPLAISGASAGGGVAMQFCDSGSDADHIFGVVATTNGTFAAVQSALTSLSHARCLSGFTGSVNITASTYPITPQVIPAPTNSTSQSFNRTTNTSPNRLVARADCTTIQVVYGDSCATLAAKCEISGSDFTTYNPGADFCSTLVPYQHVCCSAGTLPDFAPKPDANGTCATYTVVNDDSCSTIAASYSILVTELESFNNNTWAWNGCDDLWVGTLICLSEGNPPMPAPVANTLCGPQVPGTPTPPSGTDLSTLNPCPLNACCDVWGQCGTTSDFCTNTSTGAPGTAKPGTNGCISNCGTNIVMSAAPDVFRSVTYFEGFNLDRPCLYMDAEQIDTSVYTHVHFAFATLSSDYEVLLGNGLSTYEFENFVALVHGPKRIITFGGWEFSTSSSTYQIFREAVTAANRVKVATNIVNFVNDNNLDGVDIDWEYPGAPDIPGIPPGSEEDGTNYLAFLVVLRNLLGTEKSISIAAASSYWYLKGFPIAAISKVVDYKQDPCITTTPHRDQGQGPPANALLLPATLINNATAFRSHDDLLLLFSSELTAFYCHAPFF